MSSVAVQKQEEEWWSRELAARHLAVSVRTLRKIAQAGRIRRKHIPPAAGRPYQSVVYSVADVKAYKADAASVDASTNMPAVRSVHAPAVALPASLLPAALELLAQRLAPPPRVRRWLALDEAAEYSGLPRAFLQRFAREGGAFGIGELCMNVGTEARPRWRFDRDQL